MKLPFATSHSVSGAPVPPWIPVMASMCSAQLGAALSLGLAGSIGAAGVAWLRMTLGAVIIWIFVQPNLRNYNRKDWLALIALGAATGFMSASMLAAITKIQLGTAVAIQFLGPLSVAAIASRHGRALIWPFLAFSGVILVTRPWRGEIDPVGIGFAALGAVFSVIYMLLTKRVGTRLGGVGGLAVTIPVAAVAAGLFGVPQAWGNITPGILAAGLGLTLLLPVLPLIFEMFALRYMSQTAFGTLMAFEPALGALLGLIVLGQLFSPLQAAGILLVVIAGIGAQGGSAQPAV